MSNIELHGFDTEKTTSLTLQLEGIMRNLGFGNDAVVSFQKTQVISLDGKRTPMPYVRICSTDRNEIRRIIKAFGNFKIKVDVEWLVLGGFVPANEMG